MAKRDIQQRVIDKLKALRLEKGLTQQDVYNDTNIHIGRIESGKANITLKTLDKIADYYQISIAELVL